MESVDALPDMMVEKKGGSTRLPAHSTLVARQTVSCVASVFSHTLATQENGPSRHAMTASDATDQQNFYSLLADPFSRHDNISFLQYPDLQHKNPKLPFNINIVDVELGSCFIVSYDMAHTYRRCHSKYQGTSLKGTSDLQHAKTKWWHAHGNYTYIRILWGVNIAC